MKSKSAKDIYKQGMKLMQEAAIRGWNGKEYTDESSNRIDYIYEVSQRYVANIVKYLTGTDWLPNDKYDAKVERCIYAKF